ncbi:MAG: Ig-like domain repeat protein, partial [Bryobacteraceae bacterium]
LLFSTNPTYTLNFSANTGDENPCTSSTSLSPGTNCDVSVLFTPQSIGSLSAGITVTNNTLNVSGSTEQVAVSGTGFSSVRSTTTTVTVSPPSSTFGQLLTFTATVSAEEPTDVPYRPRGVSRPTGTVTFTDLTTSTTLASNVSLTLGVATLSLSTLGAGSHTIHAVYTPTGIFSTSNGGVALTIAKADTSTSITLSGRTLTAAVTVIAPGAGTPTGTVQFLNGNSVLGTVTLSGGTAALTLAVTPSSFTFTAAYSGDSNFNSSSSAAVNSPPTSFVSLTSSVNPSALGQAVTFTAAVSGQPPTSGSATGTVQFSDGATLLGSVSVSDGLAVFTTSSVTGGSHNIIARYSGNSTFPSAQATLDQIVNAPVTMMISAAPMAPVFGQTVVLTASVSATVPAGFQAPTGQVTWVELASGTSLGTAPLSSGIATLSLNSLAAGTHTITALYSGDATWNITSSALTVTVSRATSSSAVSIAVVSGQLMLTANVSSVAPGAGTPTGSVQFVDVAKNAIVAAASLSSGRGSATIGTGAIAGVLGRPIAAVYAGDSNFNGSKSAPLPALLNAAWNFSGDFAPDEIASLYGITGLTGNTTATPPLTASLGGVTVTITDSSGTVKPALLYGVYASAGQINLLVPTGTVPGLAVVTITLPGGGAITTIVNIVATAPGIFTSDMNGQGNYAGQVVYVHPDGSQTIVNSTGPISLAAGNQVYLVLYGTGLRHAKSVTATVNGASVPVIYFGAQGGADGVDQINVGPLPASLAGAGVVKLVIAADGQAANTVTLNIQ